MHAGSEILPPRYRGPQPIGRGGMGEIYRATDSTLGRAVAVKVLADRFAQDAEVRGRFTREALAAARISGETHTVTIFDVGEHNGRPFIVMEYLSGGSLEDVIRSHGAVEPRQALAWLEDAAEALDAAHANGVVHRDIKPANLLLDRGGGVHVADFGIASAAGTPALTQPGTILGTAGYLSPEQALGETAGPASDAYALAVVAFELLVGERPFGRDTTTAEAAAHVNAPVPRISVRNERLPPRLDPVFRRALAKDPHERFGSCAELVAAIRAALSGAEEPTAVSPPGPRRVRLSMEAEPPLHPRRHRRRRAPIVAVAVLLLGGAGAAAAALLALQDDSGARPDASTLVTTVVTTTPVTTQEVTVTATAPTTAPTSTSGGGSISDGIALTDQATALLGQGRWAEALPVAQRALSILKGSGHTYEGYANYDVGKALAELGRCEEALPYLERREQLLGPHPDVTAAKEKCG